MDFGAALIALVTALVVKVAVMVFGGWLLYKLYRARQTEQPDRLWILLPDEDQPEVRILWWSLVLFAIGELTCGVEVYVLFKSSPIFSACHAITSAFGMGLFALGAYLFLDKKLFRYGGRGCIGNRICKGCTIAEDDGCKFRTLMTLIAVFVVLVAIAPFFTSTERMFADMKRWALPFASWNTWYDGTVVPWLVANVEGYDPTGVAFSLPPSMLVIEFRILPALALALAAASIPLARSGREPLATKLLVFATGVLSYSYFELVLYRVTGDVLLGSLAHEIVEFWFLIVVAEFLRRSFPPEVAGEASGEGAPAPAV